MKKSLVVALGMMVSVFTFGAAYAADNQPAAGTGGQLTNGITYFNLGPASTCTDPAGPIVRDVAKPFNGVTVFDIAKAGSGAQGSCAGRTAQMTTTKVYNGITAF